MFARLTALNHNSLINGRMSAYEQNEILLYGAEHFLIFFNFQLAPVS
ncbi:MAG: hypothetical protein WCG25_05810 [bacterium]